MSDIVQATILFIALLTLLLAALVVYLVSLLVRVESMLWRLTRYLRPEVLRDRDGRRLYERVD